MPNLVNNDTNPDSNLVNHYLNYITPVVQGESIWSDSGVDLSGVLTSAWGNSRERWTKHATNNSAWALRPPSVGVTGVNESLTGNITAPTTGLLTTGSRFVLQFTTNGTMRVNATNGTSNFSVALLTFTLTSTNPYAFVVVNAYAISICMFTSTARTSASWLYLGWIRSPAYTGTQFPRNLVAIRGTHNSIDAAARVNTENLTTAQSLYITQDLGGAGIFNPAISCSVSTPGADTIEIFLRNNASPYNYIGQPYFLIQGPSSLTVGKIYKNNSMVNGRDWEGSDNPYWMCICKPAGGRTLLMRVWTEGIL